MKVNPIATSTPGNPLGMKGMNRSPMVGSLAVSCAPPWSMATSPEMMKIAITMTLATVMTLPTLPVSLDPR